MREILFRGKWTRNGKWIEGFYARIHDGKGNVSHRIYPGYAESDCGEFYPEWFEVDPSTVGQYTGLCDKNGRKAFTADISIDSQGRKWVIFTCPGGFRTCRTAEWELMCNGILTPANVGLSDIQNAEWFENCHEVIGNVVDNPELLEGEE